MYLEMYGGKKNCDFNLEQGKNYNNLFELKITKTHQLIKESATAM